MSTSVAVPPGYLPVLDGMMGELEARIGLGGYFPASMQLLRFGLGQQYEEHTDCDPYLAIEGIGSNQRFGSATEAVAGHKTDRAATMLVYLNGGAALEGDALAAKAPPLAGGETTFPLLNVSIAPSEGLAVLWNNIDARGFCNARSMHAARPPTRGVKYMVQKWYHDGDTKVRRLPKLDKVHCDASGSCREYVVADAPVTTSINIPQFAMAMFTAFHHVVLEQRAFQDALCPPPPRRLTVGEQM
jgi:hypothetical protein